MSHTIPQEQSINNLKERLISFRHQMDIFENENITLIDAESLEAFENSQQKLLNEYADIVSALKLQQHLASETSKTASKDFIRGLPRKMLNLGYRTLSIRFKNGTKLEITDVYFYPKSKVHKRHRKIGLYPGLLLLGISDRYTPGLESTISLLAASSSSFEEASLIANEMLGFKPDVKRIIRTVKIMAENARKCMLLDNIDRPDDFKGRVVAASVDGGRIRIRTNKRGKKTKKRRTRYKTDWREPKLIVIYLIGDDGKKEKKTLPMIDATLNGPDETFALLTYYLKKLNVCSSDLLLFVSDGATWIWERAKKIASLIGIDENKCFFALDYYHAVEHLSDLANLKKWSKKEKNKWVNAQKKRLLQGDLEKFMAEINRVCKGSKNSKVKRERAYFQKHLPHMHYAELKASGLPIGSGAVESSIRRVINLRLKGPGIFWHEDTADAMLMLRSFYKAGRWKLLKQMANIGRLAID